MLINRRRRKESFAKTGCDDSLAVDNAFRRAKKVLRKSVFSSRSLPSANIAHHRARVLATFVAYSLFAGGIVVGVQAGGGAFLTPEPHHI